MSWSELVDEALGTPRGGAGRGPSKGVVERITVRSGEVSARVGGHEVSLIRTVWCEQEWVRVCAALASQPLFRARLIAGELPEAAARVFALLGLDLVPRGWGALVATCSCDHWRGRCAHLVATAAALGSEADRDPFALTRWAGRGRRALVELVGNLPAGTKEPDRTPLYGEAPETGRQAFVEQAQSGDPLSPAAFWFSAPPPPPPPLPDGVGDRVRAAAPGHVADYLPGFYRSGKPFAAGERGD